MSTGKIARELHINFVTGWPLALVYETHNRLVGTCTVHMLFLQKKLI